MVPATINTDLNEITPELLVASREFFEFGGIRNTTAVGPPQLITVDIGHDAQAVLTTDRAVAGGGGAEIATGSQQLGVGIADIDAGAAAGSKIAQNGPTSKRKIYVVTHKSEPTPRFVSSQEPGRLAGNLAGNLAKPVTPLALNNIVCLDVSTRYIAKHIIDSDWRNHD